MLSSLHVPVVIERHLEDGSGEDDSGEDGSGDMGGRSTYSS